MAVLFVLGRNELRVIFSKRTRNNYFPIYGLGWYLSPRFRHSKKPNCAIFRQPLKGYKVGLRDEWMGVIKIDFSFFSVPPKSRFSGHLFLSEYFFVILSKELIVIEYFCRIFLLHWKKFMQWVVWKNCRLRYLVRCINMDFRIISNFDTSDNGIGEHDFVLWTHLKFSRNVQYPECLLNSPLRNISKKKFPNEFNLHSTSKFCIYQLRNSEIKLYAQ